jgi:predicted nucleic acid-binding protein
VIVVDASAIVDLLVPGPGFRAISARVRGARSLAAPHLLDAEVGQVLRRFERAGVLTVADAGSALADLSALPIARYAHGPLLARAFDLRHNATIYDALYLVLAEATGAPLITRDAALAAVPGHRAAVEVL